MTLLEKATEIKVTARQSKGYDMPELAELSVAWALGDATTSQVSYALGYKTGSNAQVYCNLASGLRGAVRLGLLVKPK